MENTKQYEPHELELIGDSYWVIATGEHAYDKLPDQFSVKDDSSLEWVMQKFFDAEHDLKSEEAKIDAIMKTYAQRRGRKLARLNWLKARFTPEIEAYAKTKLSGKTKYIDTPFGRIAWRIQKGGLRVVDKAAALSLAKANVWSNAVKVTEEFQISQLTAEQLTQIQAYCTKSPKEEIGFELTPDTEVCSIKVASI